MESVLVKIFAAVLTLSQVLVQPTDIKTSLDPERDRQQAVELLRQGCVHMQTAFAIEDLNLDDLIATAMDDPEALSAKFHGVRFSDLHTAYRVLCNGSKEELPFDVGQVIEFHNQALVDLPDHTRLRELKLPGTTTILDRNGETFAEVFEPANRRVSVLLSAVSPLLKAAFIAAEDKRFLEHKGVDERGLIRAFITNMAGSGGLQGGSTITQQVAKNLLVGTENSYVRKMREVVIASRLEATLSKDEILQIYLNAIYLGRGAWGVETAAQRYFGKSADGLPLAESALLAGLAKGPSLYNPDRNAGRGRERSAYVLTRMKEDGVIDAGQLEDALATPPAIVPYSTAMRDSGYHFVDYLRQQAKQAAGIKLLTEDSYVIQSTIDPELQKSAEAALQEGLASYETKGGRAKFVGAELNLTEKIQKLDQSGPLREGTPSWLRALRSTRLPLYDVHWPAGVVLPESGSKAGRYQVGLSDGRVLPLEAATSLRGRLKPFDVVRVKVLETRSGAARAELRIQPQVQGTAIVLENRSGRILAMAGGFSYASSQLNRATQTYRQPGSALKPVTYLAALANGLQPNTLVSDSPLTLPPIGKVSRRAQDAYWSPQNYDGSSRSTISLRQALENSRNLATAHLLTGGIADRPEVALDKVCDIAREAQIYRTCVRYYPFILGAQPVRALDLARFYAGIANEGAVPEPHAIESVSLRGQVRYEFGAPRLQKIDSADPAAFYQLKSILQGVVLRGTAARLADLAPYVAGKTGTTDDAIDAWFVGFSNDVTIAVWVGYDNAKGRRTLGDGRTGANVAIPIFEPILRASWKIYPKSVLAPPTSEASLKLVREDAATSPKRSRFQIVEYLRKDAKGKTIDARYALLSKDSSEASARRRSRGHDALALSTGNDTQAWPWFGQERPSGARQGWNGDLGAPQYNTFDQHGVFRFRY